MAWEDFTSADLYSHCGDTGADIVENLLDGTGNWAHVVNHEHTLVLDMGSSKEVTKIRTKNRGVLKNDDVDVYVSDTIGTWGSSILNFDPSGDPSTDTWVEREVDTPTTGRYVKLTINTQQVFNYLDWGNSEKCFDVWTGALPKRWYSIINLCAQNYTTASASYVPSDGTICLLDWDGAKYSNIIAAYFEVTGNITGAGEGDSWGAQLYDRTNTTELGSVSAVSAQIKRSTDISASLPAGAATLDVRIKNNGATSVAMKSARLIIVQETDAGGDKMRVYLPVGQQFTNSATSYVSGSGERLGDCEHQFKYVASKFSTITAAYHHAVIRATSTKTAYSALDDVGAGGEFGEVSTTSTSPDLKKSADIKASLVNDTIYTSYLKSSANRSNAYQHIAWLVIDLNPVTSYQFVNDICAFGKKEATNTGWQTSSTEYRSDFNTGDTWCKECYSEGSIHTSVSGHSSATSIGSSLYDDTVRDTNADVTETSSGANYNESSAITPANDSEMWSAWNVNSLGFLAYGILYNNNILTTICLEEPTGTNMQLNIGDVWKEVSAMQINIGDTWKAVAGAQVNIGDTWKTIF